MIRSILALLLIAVIYSISVPVDSQDDRCMIVFSRSADDYLKIDMKFEKFHGQTNQEYYRVQLINTETHHLESFNVTEGLFRREIQLAQNVIYRLCVKIMLNRFGSSQIQQYYQYNSGIRHEANIDKAHVEIPANLLKVKDLQDTYRELIALAGLDEQVTKITSDHRKSQDDIFLQQTQKIKRIETITFIEILVICLFGIYQYYRLKNMIDSKHNS